MAFDGLITKSIVNELNSSILNGKINKIYEPNKNELILGIYANGKNYALNISIDSSTCRVNLTTHSKPNPLNALNYCMFLRKHILSYKIKKIITHGLERIVIFELEGYDEINNLNTKKLIVELMGKHSNVILVNEDDIIMDSLRHLDITLNSTRDIFPARKYVLPPSNKKDFTNTSFEDFLLSINSEDIAKSISSNYTGLSMTFIESRIKKLEINTSSKDDLNKLYLDIKKFINNIDNTSCVEYINNKGKKDFILDFCDKNENLDINFYIDDFYFNKYNNDLFISYRNSILKLILSYLTKYKNRLKNINNKLNECNNKDIYKLYGELITSNLYRIKNENSEHIKLENYYNNNVIIEIPLNKKYSVSENAKQYFKKYNKLKNAFDICSIQKKETENELNYIESIVYELENSNNINDINIIYNEISQNNIFKNSFNKKTLKEKDTTPSSLHPIELKLDGYTILVGKNNLSNDYLTTKIASKNDLWFHTKFIHGSHVVLKLDNQEFPNDDIIVKCAQIAAYHSKAKLSSNVPVDYCLIKYVKKPNKSKPGMVIYSHNKTINVTPEKN